MLNGLPRGLGILILSFRILCASSFSFPLPLGSLIAVRMLLALTLRECDGVRIGRAFSSSCFLEMLALRACDENAEDTDTGLLVDDFGGGSGLEASDGETGEVTGVEEAMVPPTPVLEIDELILSGALRVIEQGVDGMLVVGVSRAGLCGEPMAITKGIFEPDAALILRSGGGDV